MAKKKKFGAILEKQTKQIPVVKQKAPKTISTNVSTGGMRSAVSSTTQSVAKSARQKAEEDRSARMRQGLSKTFSAVVRSGFNQKMSQPTRVKKGMFQSLGNALQPVKKNASSMANTRSTGAPIGQIKSSILAPVKQDIKDNPYDAVRKVGMKGSRNERKVYVPMWQRDENGQISSNQRRLENAARGGNRKAQVEAVLGRTKAQTRSGHTYDQYINAELNKKGLLGQDYILRSKDPSKEAMDYRQRYGFDKEALDRVLAIANNTPASGDYAERFNGQDDGSVLDRLKFGFDESYRTRNIEDTLRRQYGVELSDEDQAKLDAVRGSGGYMVGNMLGQASQFAMTAPLSGAVEGKLLAKVGLKGGKAAIKTTGDALKYAGARIGADQIVSDPVNILDALKADNGEEFIKRLGLNTAMDVFFGGLTEIPGLRKNIHFVRGLEMNNAANATSDASQKLVAKVGAQRELRQAVEEAGDAARLEAIQNANGISASTMNGADALDMVDDNALRSIENMGYGSDVAREANAPNVSAPAENAPRRYTPQNAEQSARIQNALNTIDQYGGLDRMLRTADDTDRLIRTFQDPAFNDVDMLEGVANNLFPEGKMRSIRIDAERAYSNDVRAFDADPESFDFIQPVREDYYIDLLSKEVVDELQRSRNVRDIIPQLADDLGVSEDELLDALRRTEGEFYGYAPSEGVRNARTVVENAPAQNFDAIADARDVYQNAVKYYDDLIADLEARGDISNETLQWLRARRNATDKARLKAGKNLKSADEYVDRFAKDIDYVRDRIYKTDGYDIFERHSVGKANEEIRSALSEMNERLTPINGRRQPAQMVTKESANVVPNERTVRRPNRQIKEGDVSSSLLRNLGYDGVDEVAGAADNVARAIPAENTARRAAEQATKSESVEDVTERLIRKWGDAGNETSYRHVVKQYEGMSAAELKNEKEALQRMANTSSIDPDEAADRIAVIDAISREKNADRSIGAKRTEAQNIIKQVDKEFNDAIRKRSYKGNPLRAYPRSGDMRILYMDDAYNESEFRRLIRKDIEEANAKANGAINAKAAKTEPKAGSAWDDIPNVAKSDEAPQDLMRANPHRKENTIPKASDQKTRKEVLFRGETADRNGVKETAEQVAEAPKKRNQVKGILGEEKPKTEEPKTKFSEMNDHELQSERYRYEEQSKYDKTAGTSEDRIAEIDEEFARRGKEPKWTRIEPEQGGKRVMSEEEVARAKKEQGEKYGTYENKTPRKTDTPDGEKRVHKTFDREVEKQSAEVQHEMGNELFGEHAHTSDGKTVDEFVEEFNNKFNENPEAYSRKLVDDDVEMDYRERQVGLFMAKGQWRDEVNSLERKLQKENLDADVKRSLEDRLATASEMERITTEKYVKIVPEAASILKIHGVLNKLSKHTKGEYIDETIRRMEKKYRKRLDKFGIDHIYVSDELRDALKNAKEPIEISQAWMEITAELWDQIPASMKEKLDFFRVNAMLFNLPTHVRNFAGNVLFAPLREAKNLQAAGLEKIAQKLNLIDQSDRTKAFIPKPALKKRGKALRAKYGEVINEGFKFFDDIAEGRPHGKKMFMAGRQNGHGLAFMNGIRRVMDFLGNANLKALSAEDKVMFSSAFDTAFAREATARGLSPEDLINNPKLEQKIIEDAATEALRSTFNDVSAFTRALNRIANPGENAHITRKIIGLSVNAIQPFIKVPVNILRRGIDYSPFGWGKGIYHIGKGWHMHDPKMITKGIDQLASGTTGTAVALTGWLLAKHDRINAQIGNDDDEMFMKDLGKQKFSIVLKKDGDEEFSYSIDWSQPGAIPLFWGVTLERISEEGLQNVNLWEVADLFEAAFEPVEELSVLQGLKNTSETFQDEDNWVKGIESVIINTGLQYVGQFLPTSVKRVARQVDPIRRDTSSHAEESTKRTVEKWWNKQRAGIPSNPVTDALHISSTSLPAYKNAWGEVQSNTYSKDWKGRVLENFVSPGYLKDYKPDKVDKFLLDMYNKDKSATDLFPERNWKGTVSFKGQNIKLTNDELDYYDRLAGQESKKEIKRRLDAGDFEGLSLSEQRKIVRDIYADANLKATQKTLLKQGKDPWDVYSDSLSDTQKNYKDIKATGIKPETYYQYATTDAHDLNENGYTSKAEWVMYLNNQDLTDEQRAALYPLRATGDNPYLDGTAYTKDWEKENEKNLSKSSKAAATKFEKATPRDAGSIAANLFDKSVIQRAGEMRAAADASSSGSSGGSRSGRRSGGGGGSSKTKARAKTASEKRFAALQKMKAPTTGKGIEALSQGAKGLTKAQKKALLKLMQKKLEV